MRRPREPSATSCMSSPASSRPSPRPRSGSASTVGTKSRPPRNSRSRTESSRSPHAANPNARSATSRSSNFAARDSCQASTPTGSPPTACMSFRGSRKASPSRRTSCRPSACPPASPPSTRCWSMATGQARPPWSLGRQGQGKRSWGLHFIFNGAAAGQPGVIATLQENTTQLDRIVKGFGWSLASESVELMYRSPVDLYLDEWVYELIEVIERTGARRVFIDSLGDLRRAAVDELRFREYLYSLLQRCANQQISVMMSQEIPALFGISHISEDGISHISDNVILLQFVPRDAATTACRDGAQDPRNQTRSRRPRVQHHPGRHRARRAAQQLHALTTSIGADQQQALIRRSLRCRENS